VRLTNVKQVQIEQDDTVFSIKATLSGPEGPVSFDFEPGILVVDVHAADVDAEAEPETTRMVTVPEDVSIREPFLRIEDGILIVDLPKVGRNPAGVTYVRSSRPFDSHTDTTG